MHLEFRQVSVRKILQQVLLGASLVCQLLIHGIGWRLRDPSLAHKLRARVNLQLLGEGDAKGTLTKVVHHCATRSRSRGLTGEKLQGPLF